MIQMDTLRETRGSALAECQRLVDGARAEDRELNDAERRAFDEHRQLADDITHRLEEWSDREAAADRSARAFERAGIDQNNGATREYRGGDVTREVIRTVENMRMASDDAKQPSSR